MTDQPRIELLMAAWEEALEPAPYSPPERVCVQHPHLLAVVAVQLQKLPPDQYDSRTLAAFDTEVKTNRPLYRSTRHPTAIHA